jgi:Ser/Thr protein kinase RdoA (MazF antagonist)
VSTAGRPDAAAQAAWAVEAFGLPSAGLHLRQAPTGLIQTTFLCRLADGRRLVVQRLHPIFAPTVVDDLDAITAHLERLGLPTPRPLRTPAGQLTVADDEGRPWRILTYLDGATVDRLPSPAMAAEAGGLLGRFHQAVSSLTYEFRFVRAGAHDTAAHLARLERAAGGELEGPREVAEAILAAARRLPALPDAPRRITHGDLKISNVLFEAGEDGRAQGRAVALLDLDTLSHLTLAYEVGDALRSWCNPLGEDTCETVLDLAVMESALGGYAGAAAQLLLPSEVDSLVPGLQTVSLELAARFAVDAFEDRYFGWDPSRFPSRREHNRVRAQGQLHLALTVERERARAEALVRQAFRR